MDQLKKGIRLIDLVMLGAGTAIGSSVFTVMSPAAKIGGSGLLIALLLSTFPMMIFGWIYAFMASATPRTAATFEWQREYVSPVVAFGIAWMRILSNAASMTLLARTLVNYLSMVVTVPIKPVMTLLMVVVFALNYFGVAVAARVQTVLMLCLLGVFAVFVIAGSTSISSHIFVDAISGGWQPILAALPLMITLFLGIETTTEVGDEVEDPRRNVPLGLFLAMLLTTFVYLAISAASLSLIGPEGLASSTAPLLSAAEVVLGGWAKPLIVTAAIVALLKSMNAVFLVYARFLYAMGKAGQLPSALGRVHPRWGTPHVATLLALLLSCSGMLLPSGLVFLVLAVGLPTVAKYLGSCLAAYSVVTRYPSVHAGARIQASRATVKIVSVAGVIAALGVGSDQRPYFVLAGWLAVGLAYYGIRMRSRGARGLLASCLLASVLATRATQAAPMPTVTTQGFDIVSKDGVSAKIYTFSYVRPPAKSQSRPVLFAWNGGPGAPSALVHFGLLGPRRFMFPQPREEPGPIQVVDNELSLLDVADVVFVDPVGTGYSQIDGAAAPRFFDSDADGFATAALIRAWLRAHDRLSAPVYLLGESYGGTRVAIAAHYLSLPDGFNVNLAGLVLISQTITNELSEHREVPNILSYVASLPVFTRIAAYHGVLRKSDGELKALERAAVEFAGGEYLPALYRGRDLTQREREYLAERLEHFTGIARGYFLEHGLTISRDDFCRKLLEKKGLVLSSQDARYAGPADTPDPLMAHFVPSFDSTVHAELDELPKPTATARYEDYSPEIAESWHFGSSTGERPNVRYIEQAMTQWPALRLMIVEGNYDLGSSVGVSDYVMRHSSIDQSRTILVNYEAGHMVYMDPASAADLSRRLHALVGRR